MPLKIVRNDITKMCADAIVNTANDHATVGTGCDHAIYQAAGYAELLKYRTEKIGFVPEGDVFITPGFRLNCRYIIHAVSPFYVDGKSGEEELLRSCYRKSLQTALEHDVTSIAFPLIATGGFQYPKEEGFRIAVDEINAFLMKHEMPVYLVVFDSSASVLGSRFYPGLESYIDQHYVDIKEWEEYDGDAAKRMALEAYAQYRRKTEKEQDFFRQREAESRRYPEESLSAPMMMPTSPMPTTPYGAKQDDSDADFYEKHESALRERIRHSSDTFSEYLIYLIDSRGMSYPEVYKRAIVDKKVFSKIKNNPAAHPKKITAMCLCVGARLNLDQTKDLLARAGYALSPCDKTDIIFSYFIENEIYDMIELDIQLEEHGLPCLIS